MADDAAPDEGNDKPTVWVNDEGIAHYRASGLGGCTAAMIALRQGFTAMAPPKSMQDRYNEGHLHEPDIVRRANTEFGLEVFNRQREVEVWVSPTAVIVGHIDGEVVGWLPEEIELGLHRMGDAPPHRLFEAKTMSDAAFKKWMSMSWPERWGIYHGGYAKQLTVYLAGTGLASAVYAVKNKESGKVVMEAVPGPPLDLNQIKVQVFGVEAHVRQGLPLPEVCDVRQFPCPVFYLGPCGDDERETLDDRKAEVVLALAQTYEAAKANEVIAKQAKEKARDEIKRHLGDAGKFAAEGWKVTYSKRELKGTKTVEIEEFDLAQLRADHPDLCEQYTTTTTQEVEEWSSERLTVTPPKQAKS